MYVPATMLGYKVYVRLNDLEIGRVFLNPEDGISPRWGQL